MTPAERTARWRAADPERSRASKRAYYQTHRKAVIEKTAQWQAMNPEKKREINRRRRLRMVYGITVEQFDAMLAIQGGTCAICAGSFKSTSDRHVDHCHRSGKVRGILCGDCNRGLGVLEKKNQWIARATIYLGMYSDGRSVLSAGLWRSHNDDESDSLKGEALLDETNESPEE